jgi:DUF4097 and DUF4098 domain-containing protein YvlB
MSKRTKIWLIAGASLTLLGIIAFVGAMTFMKWDFKKLSTKDYVTNTYDITEKYKGISVITDTADVVFLPSNDSKTTVVCYEQVNTVHNVSVKNGVLTIEIKDTRKWYEHIGIGFDSQKITVKLPASEYGALSVKSSTGKVTIPKDFGFESVSVVNSTGGVECLASATGKVSVKVSTGHITLREMKAGSLDLEVSTGKISLSSVECENDVKITVSTGDTSLVGLRCGSFYSKGTTGDILLSNVTVAGKMSVERSTGDIELERSDAAELFLKTSTGDVEGTLASDKVFFYDTDTGEVELPKTTTGGKCEIKTDTGDIEIDIVK